MAFKLIVLTALVACASAGLIQPQYYSAPAGPIAYAPAGPVAYAAHAAPVAYAAHAAPVYAPVAKTVITKAVDAEHDPHPQYSYAYDVQDALTGDSKSQHETRDGDVVHGSYSVNDPDGTKRTVDYTADPVNGFNAVVHKEPSHVAVKTVAHHAVPAAPLAYHHAAPAQQFVYAQPAAYAHY